ncbi:hypothetical protein [Nocardia sp. NPDC052112]|uniref:hypothetical protein n=1 Tax=Nocardia sp. NPDC052112 TaxID=3155646 RepID=UPI00344AFB0C
MSVAIDVFNTGYLPIDGAPGWDPDTAATWPGSTATLISGARDAILVGALMTVDEDRRLAHMWLWNSTPDSRRTWLATIDKITDLDSATIIAGHRDPGAPDDDAERQLAQSRSYIEAFDRAVAEPTSPQEVIDEMTDLFPDYGNP